MAAVAGGVGDGDLAPWQALELLAQRGLVGLDDQQPGGVLVGDQPLGVLALGMHGIGRHDGVGQVQALQQRPEPGDLFGGVVHLGLCQDRAGGVVHRRQEVSSAAAVAGVGDVGEVGEQAAALAGRHRDGRGRMGDGRDG
jgi:hypothetical protein